MSSLFSTFSVLLSHFTVEMSIALSIALWVALCLGMKMIVEMFIDPLISTLVTPFISLDRRIEYRTPKGASESGLTWI